MTKNTFLNKLEKHAWETIILSHNIDPGGFESWRELGKWGNGHHVGAWASARCFGGRGPGRGARHTRSGNQQKMSLFKIIGKSISLLGCRQQGLASHRGATTPLTPTALRSQSNREAGHEWYLNALTPSLILPAGGKPHLSCWPGGSPGVLHQTSSLPKPWRQEGAPGWVHSGCRNMIPSPALTLYCVWSQWDPCSSRSLPFHSSRAD